MALTAKKVYAILKHQISDMEAKLNSPVRYRGTVATADLLPLNPDIGDMYNIESKSVYGEAGMNVAWNGVVWDTMGAPIDMSLYFTKEEAEAVIQRLVTEYFEKNPVKPGATTEQAQQIEQNKTDIASLKTETGSLKEDIVNLKEYQVVANTTLESEVSTVIFDKNIDGEPITLKNAVIFVFSPIPREKGKNNGYVIINNGTSYYGAINWKQDDVSTFTLAECNVFGESAPSVVTFSNAITASIAETSQVVRSIGSLLEYHKKINSLMLIANYYFDIGTRIVILGK